MTRPNESYRSSRRNNWCVRKAMDKALGDAPETWAAFNARFVRHGFGIKVWSNDRVSRAHVARSKYMPHIGKKQREKGALCA